MNSSGNLSLFTSRFNLRRGLAFGIIIIAALLAFEIFNYSTTDYALGDLLGNLTFAGLKWSTILAIAFCGIDFAGIARLFTPQDDAEAPNEVWYLFGAWLLAATMNAMLTWWGVSLAIINHQSLGDTVIARDTMLRVVPIFVAVLVWLIRVLIIGTFSVAGDKLFSQTDKRFSNSRAMPVRSLNNRPASAPAPAPAATASPRQASSPAPAYRPSPKPAAQNDPNYSRPEPTYHPVSMSPSSSNNNQHQTRR